MKIFLKIGWTSKFLDWNLLELETVSTEKATKFCSQITMLIIMCG